MILSQQTGHNVSKNYKVIDTQEVVNKLLDLGYQVQDTVVNKTKKEEKQGFQKHRVILTHEKFNTLQDLGTIPQLVLTNSYDATSSLRFDLGFYRMICSNGLMVGRGVLGDSIRHQGDVDSKIDSILDNFNDNVNQYSQLITKASKINLDDSSTKLFKEKTKELIFKDKEVQIIGAMANPRRRGDLDRNLWTQFNRYQEAAIRGGIKYYNLETEKYNTTRKVKSIKRQDVINSELFNTFQNLVKYA